MGAKEPTMLTVREASEKTGAAIPTVNLWCRSGRLPGARQESTPYGDYWLIPESALEGIVVRGRGRPPKAKPAQSNGKKRGKK
jgi:predicted site-specific integrase-resolvase